MKHVGNLLRICTDLGLAHTVLEGLDLSNHHLDCMLCVWDEHFYHGYLYLKVEWNCFYFGYSLDAYKNEQEKGMKALNLKRRRLKLAELLQRERDEYEVRYYLTVE